MTKNFITLSAILDSLKNERVQSPRMEDAPKFLEWQTGFVVAHKNDRSSTYKIKGISDGDKATYQSAITLESTDDATETRMLRGPTLQSGYVFVSRGDAADPAMASKTTKPITFATDMIRSFAPRTKGRPGSRVIMKDGVSYPVVEDHDTILDMITRATSTEADAQA